MIPAFEGKRPVFRAGRDICMTSNTTDTSGSQEKASPGKAERKARLAEELRANLARRKAQARSRRTGGADERPEGIGTARSGATNDNEPSGQERGG